jgi:predicted kinase
MMIGRPGAGKSFFARQFSAMFGAPVVSYDRLRFELFTQPTYNNEEQEILDRLVAYQVEELLKTNRTFMIDGGCNSKVARANFMRGAKQQGYNTLAVWVQTDEVTCKFRATKRNKRRTDDAYNLSLTPDQYTNQSKRLTQPTSEPHVVISGKHTYNAQARVVLKKIIEPREALATEVHNETTEKQIRSVPGRNIIVR